MAEDNTDIEEKTDSVDADSAADVEAVPPKASKLSSVSPSGGVVSLAGNVEIYPDKKLPDYNSLQNKAYKAVVKGKSMENALAIVCERNFIPRRHAASVYSSIINPALIPVAAHGKVYWPPEKEERYVIVYKHVLGQRLLQDDQALAMGWKQETVLDAVVKPMVDILQDFRDKDFVHGAIRPSNMFDGLGGGKDFVLGDCLSTSASYTQPSLFEPIERAMADPIGRGIGTLPDDLYAFGVSLAVMMRSSDPLSGLSDEEVIHEKIQQGSYAAITGKDRFKGSILELLRGLLHDDPSQRWTIDEVLIWLDGRRLSPKQALKRPKAARPFPFGGGAYSQTPLLAMSLSKSPSEVVKVVDDGTLEQWLSRSLDDAQTVERFHEAQQYSAQGGRGAGYEDRVVANMSSILDTMAPIRYRGHCISGDGVGTALHEAFINGDDVKVFADMFLQRIAMNWVTVNENPNLDVTGLISKYDACKGFLQQNNIGFGLERCLYLLAPEAPCLSVKLKNYYVSTPEDLIFAYEDLCGKGDTPSLLLDRHSAAFLSVKDSKAIDSYLFDLNAPEDFKNLLGNIKCFATIQKRSNLDNFPNIAKAFNKQLPILYKRYHDKKVREKMKEEMDKFVKAGDLVKMASLLDSPEIYDKDFKGFREAMGEYNSLRSEKDKLEKQLENENTFGRATGKEFAAILSGILSAIIMVLTTYMFLTDKSIF